MWSVTKCMLAVSSAPATHVVSLPCMVNLSLRRAWLHRCPRTTTLQTWPVIVGAGRQHETFQRSIDWESASWVVSRRWSCPHLWSVDFGFGALSAHRVTPSRMPSVPAVIKSMPCCARFAWIKSPALSDMYILLLTPAGFGGTCCMGLSA